MKKICPYCGRAGELGTVCEGCGYVLQESDRSVSEAERDSARESERAGCQKQGRGEAGGAKSASAAGGAASASSPGAVPHTPSPGGVQHAPSPGGVQHAPSPGAVPHATAPGEATRFQEREERGTAPAAGRAPEADRRGALASPSPTVGKRLWNLILYVISVPAALFGIACFASIFVVGQTYHYTLGDNLVMFFLGLLFVAFAGRLQLAARMVSRQDRRRRIFNAVMAASFICIILIVFLFG